MILAPNSRFWWIGLFVAIGLLGWSFASDFTAPWTDQIDGNGACWSQSAHNTLAAGIIATAGVPSAFYFGTPPIPPEGFYTHHPPLLSLMLTGMFAIFGEAEWVARLLPIAFSFLGVVLLWLLVKECVNARAATFAAIAFSAMPMELRYGRMVNFEPINLVWMLALLLAWQRWEVDGRRWWPILLAALLCEWTAWLGYLFVLAVCLSAYGLARRNRRVMIGLLVTLPVSLLLFAVQIKLARPDSWHDLSIALHYRMGSVISWPEWFARIGSLLVAHIQPALWILGLLGTVFVIQRRDDRPLRQLGWSASCFFVLSVFYIFFFRNASAIHDYASFYFTVPVAMLAGVGLDAAACWCDRRGNALHLVGTAVTLGILGYLAIVGQRETVGLRRPFRILSDENFEPSQLIPELGHAMRDRFGKDVAIVCNFLPTYGPQLHYYAQHDLLPCVFTADEWTEVIADPQNAPVGGVIWLQDPRAAEIVAKLPPGPQEQIAIRGIPFCFWHPKSGPAPGPR
ncbi:hypothetical protein CfE428DRAFT_2141 [Chthoniobacter flavus Ellin428]|uniref:Glycosyltransferase RgtA/B/C/D-like domain-containing protein n=1 Tax=Chthoniobacter flavus Ellin428 TaxID=497964 RepID=B4CZQ3_9BACT|nr:glycosyltransferase family 39 protein [Chthoniobacter flavus]EDY20217.1 hypothetical protein CfE428DRAFT_2141 [Chthoniobacter flavus Ellin428]TCO94114.1 dolichyl-phosphate-mannose-protein mannosyltransferase [Chthoniobacter flavus]